MYRRRFPVPPPGGYGGYGGGYGHNPRNSYAMILALQLANQIYQLEHKPPVTLALLAGRHGFCPRLPSPVLSDLKHRGHV